MMEDYQIAGILTAFATVAVCFREFWQAFGGPDPRPRPVSEPVPVASDWGKVADLPPMAQETILRASDERFVELLDSQPDGNQIAPLRPRKQTEDELEDFDVDTLKRSARIRRIHEERMARLRKAGLKLDIKD